ncbi:A disintegrin and metalloproteinase with thrombospondin motifs adt-1 (ADAMTS adt-1) [Durusdinium trenchii]|uniref:A disintegrin and metalloproteinase with thrombospondin motifs adt-1 (ADAMTS adt-1) n=1 Tax=Durusdinium trenchii TaxID=1381693 RepID=A0ABP0IWT9_9DINO
MDPLDQVLRQLRLWLQGSPQKSCRAGFLLWSSGHRSCCRLGHLPRIGTNMGSPACGDRDGRLSEWNTWSDCSCTCFGIRERQRIIEQYHTGQGRPVGHMPLKQVEPCHPRYNEQPPSECIHHHADCKLSQWNEWSQCPVTCGGGNTVRLRYIFTPASNSGRPCLGALRETKPCGEAPCGEGCVDCLWGAWAEWGACSKCGDQRFRQRDILKLPNHCGKMCEPRIAKEVQNCTSDCEKFSFCVWKPWTSWTGCSADCGPATRLRERSLGLVANQPMDFLFKVASDTNAGLCAGTQTDTEACATVPCQNQCVPKNCQFSAWSPWHQPTCIGLCTRSRSISVMNNECGRPCNGALVSTKRCLEECTEVRDCEYRAWTHWTQLDRMDDSGQRYRSREVAQLPKNGGQLCRGDLREVDGVASPEKTPVDCILMPWSTWVGCSRTCGGGWQQRQRGIQDQARNGGRPCLGDLSEGRPCGDFACEESDCELGAWSTWTSCWGGNQRSRTRVVTRPASSGGQPCGADYDGFVPMKETAPCADARTDCEVSEWSAWDSCDRTCGPGQQQRHRQVQTYPVNGGLPCPVSLRELRACAISDCNSVDCQATTWGEWGLCSGQCGSGQQTRDRSIARPAQGDGQRCETTLSETRSCEGGSGGSGCGVVNCQWGTWSAWSGCTCSCGGGQRTRNRHIAQTPQNGGAMCEPNHKEEIEPCNTHSCEQSTCRDGEWGFWQEWSPCSASCTGGLRFRHRRMMHEANECGKPAEGLSRALEPCNQGVPCAGDVDCQFDSWTQWSACTRTCDGIKRRSRRISVQGRGNGRWCSGATKETSPCNPDPGMPAPSACRPVPDQDCRLSEWSQWGECDATCGGGQRERSRSVDMEARGGGLTCRDSLSETDGCAQQECTVQGPKRDCEWSQWSQWGACNKCGGQRERFRHVMHESENGGLSCELKAAEETGKCPRQCHETMYCIWDNWESWSACSTTCGTGGVRHRQRGLALKSKSEVQALGLLYEDHQVAAQPMLLSQGLQLQLALAFAAGIVATMAMGHFSRQLSSRYGDQLPLVSQIQLASEEGLRSWRGEAPAGGYMPVSTAPPDSDIDAA